MSTPALPTLSDHAVVHHPAPQAAKTPGSTTPQQQQKQQSPLTFSSNFPPALAVLVKKFHADADASTPATANKLVADIKSIRMLVDGAKMEAKVMEEAAAHMARIEARLEALKVVVPIDDVTLAAVAAMPVGEGGGVPLPSLSSSAASSSIQQQYPLL
ncbi:hypothetical protein BC828DRAFT_373897 [Blastocladiella britannica]|nr:hypothetical protein BC828DRAFT_373897 [Blastocladiella britannica]